MSSLAAATLVVGSLLLVGVPVIWLIFRSGTASAADRQAAERAFEHALVNPDFAALERQAGAILPTALRTLYADRALLLPQDWQVALPNPGQRNHNCYIAYWQPATPNSLRDLAEHGRCMLAIANNGAGDEYLVDLTVADPPVIYLQHDSGRTFILPVTLAQFLELPRKQVSDSE
jgi:hypothetical protein